MALTDEQKLKAFADEAMRDAKQISVKIEEQTKHEFKEKIDEGRKKIAAHEKDYILSETEKIKKEQNLEVSQANIKSRQDYFKYSDSVSSRVFSTVLEKLNKFVESEEYEVYLFESCKNVIEKSGADVGIFYMPKDAEIMTVNVRNKLAELFDISQTKFIKDGTIKIGGLRFFDRTKNILINDVFDEKTDRAKELLNSIIGPQFMSVR